MYVASAMNPEYIRVIQQIQPADLLRIPVKRRGPAPTGFVVRSQDPAPRFDFTVCPLSFVAGSTASVPPGNPYDVIVEYNSTMGSLEKILYTLYQEYQDTACEKTACSARRYILDKQVPKRKVLIPSLRRQENLGATLRRFAEIDPPSEGYHPCICIIEHSPQPELESLAAQHKCEYMWIFLDPRIPQIPVGQFNRALCYDRGVMNSMPAEWYLCHDNDLLVPKDFWACLDANIQRTQTRCIQPYTHRCVLYLHPEVAERFRANTRLTDEPLDPSMHQPLTPGAAGGSLYIHRDRYVQVGGHDPHLCWGYGPEDTLFFQKLKMLGPMAYADEPPIQMLHLWHPAAASQNPFHQDMDFFVKQIFLQQTPDQLGGYIQMKRAVFEHLMREWQTRQQAAQVTA